MRKPSEMIRSHIDGVGNGFELDDLMSRHTGGVYDEVTARLLEIHQRFRTADHPIGTANPDSFPDLTNLAEDLERRGY